MKAMMHRRQLLRGALASLSLSSVAACVTIAGDEPATDLTQRVRFDPLRDYSAEPHRVRLINRDRFGPDFYPTRQPSPFDLPPGTLVVATGKREVYLIEAGGMSRRYPVAVGDQGYAWSGEAVVGRKAMWPTWYPTPSMRREVPELPSRISPGEENPLGARALYLYQNGVDTLYRIHGTSEPWTIGTDASSGCIRMFNEDVIDLFDRVSPGARVIVA